MATCYYEGEPYDCSFTDKFFYPIAESIDQSSLAVAIKNSVAIVPWAGSFHLLALAVLGGAIIFSDLRVLGIGLHSQSPQRLNRMMRPVIILSVIALIISGSLLALGEIMKLFYSPPYWVKMASMVSALLFTFGARDSVLRHNGVLKPLAMIFGALALILWLWVFIGLSSLLARVVFLMMMAALAGLVWWSGRKPDAMPLMARCASAITIALWMTTAVSGRWIAFW
ncbi:DUF6644 family protein [Henriciella litoralis]|uniref:DUF6644 family protein n=1 Tax=Henriciella litoralis TaxID=568102 RepID=UPI000A07636C|nr:DUF6644 family protein [Henriciella litoralis]